MIFMDREKYNFFLQRIKGDTMCTILNNVINKHPLELLEESGQLNQIPVDLSKVLDQYGIKAILTSFEGLEATPQIQIKGEILGLVLVHNNDVGLFYKQSDTEHRQKFTIAHELAHCCLKGDSLKDNYIEFRSNIEWGDDKEIAANTFAGELLIPEHSLKNVIKRLIKPSLQGLADIFDVSIEVMRKRLEMLKIEYYDDKLDHMINPE